MNYPKIQDIGDYEFLSYEIFNEIENVIIVQVNQYGNLFAAVNDQLTLFVCDVQSKYILFQENINTIIQDADKIQISFSKNSKFISILHQQNVYLLNCCNRKITYKLNVQSMQSYIEMDFFCKYDAFVYGQNCFIINLKTNSNSKILDGQISIMRQLYQNGSKLSRLVIFISNDILSIVKINKLNSQFQIFPTQIIQMNFIIKSLKMNFNDSKIVLSNNKDILQIFDFVNYQFINKKEVELAHIQVNEILFFNSKTFQCNQECLIIYDQTQMKLIWYNLQTSQFHQLKQKTIIQNLLPIRLWDSSIMAINQTQKLLIISQTPIPSWIGFGFKFQELQDQEEYIESESEFDKKVVQSISTQLIDLDSSYHPDLYDKLDLSEQQPLHKLLFRIIPPFELQ